MLVFWNVHQPLRVGIGTAFCFGLVMDVQQTSLLGQHAWTYTTLAFFATMVHRRIQWFKVHSQPCSWCRCSWVRLRWNFWCGW